MEEREWALLLTLKARLFLLVSQSNVEVSDCYATTLELILRLELFLFHYYFNKTLGRYTSLNVSSLPL